MCRLFITTAVRLVHPIARQYLASAQYRPSSALRATSLLLLSHCSLAPHRLLPSPPALSPHCSTPLTLFPVPLPSPLTGKVHGSLARAGKVKGQTPKVEKTEKHKKPKGRAYKKILYNRRFVNVLVIPGGGKKGGYNSLAAQNAAKGLAPPTS